MAPKTEGFIYFKFKGMSMSTEHATVVSQDATTLLVSRVSDNQLMEFVRTKKDWLLKNNNKPSCLLYGTCFVFKE